MDRPIHILVADDEEVVVSLVSDCLESDGYEVTVATSGSEAEERLQEQRFDLLITDIRMPDFDGIELLRRAKNHQEGIGAIFMTGYANMQSAKDAIKEGALDYLMKPFEIEEIRTSVRNALEKLASRGDSKAEVELDRMTRVTRLMHAVDDLPSLMRTALSAALVQCDLSLGGAIYYSPDKRELALINSCDQSEAGVIVSGVPMSENPFPRMLEEFPELKAEFFVSERCEDHPLNKRCDQLNIQQLICPQLSGTENRLVSFNIGRNNKMFGFVFIPVESEKLAELEDEFKLVSLTAQQTALSVENLLLLKETQGAYQQLQDLQSRTISLETMAARGEFAAEIGHELKNFLGVVCGNFSLLERHLDSLPSGQETGFAKYFEAILSNLDKMKRFASDLMREARLDGQKELININEQLQQIAGFMRPQKRFAKVTLETKVCSELLTLEIDPLLFQQLIYNLANNAADACRGQSDARVVIALQLSRDDESIFTISVGDNGSGIEPELLERAFESRFTTKSDGNGFGLMVCRKIIDAHRGTLQIDSTPGDGTTITIGFPRTLADSKACETARISINDSRAPSSSNPTD